MSMTKVNDINMYYEIHGEGEALILISGNGAESSQWKDMIPTFSKDYKVIPFDNRGAGRTDRPDIEYSMDMMTEDVIGLMDVLGIERAHILGASMGGMIAQNIAYLYPDRVKSLILVVTSMKNSHRVNYACKQAIKRVMDGSDPDALAEYSAVWSFPEEVLANHGAVDRIKSAMAHVLNPQTVNTFKRQNDALATFDSSGWISELTAPTLVIAGDGDIIWPQKYSGQELAKALSGSKFVSIPGAHMAYLLSAEAFQNHVVEFLTSVE
ncbi:alpha/beta hydrolase [Methanobacterium sp.]|jgi:3-oxoadipate enol-lactonase|uniref:alpha/beta fold hydrolase n=1 Tax=Methanobacterium sp. TaxID=2164 RepID=UPI0031590843